MKQKRCILGTVKLLLVCLMCSMIFVGLNTETVMAASKKSITLNQTSKTLVVGKTTTVKVKKVNGLKSKKVSFKSSNKKVASVTSKGVVKGLKAGSATITVTSKENKKVKAKFKVKVVNDFFKTNNATIKKVGKSYTQKGLVWDYNGELFQYEAKTTVKYTGVSTWYWNKNYDIVSVQVVTNVPVRDGDYCIYWKYGLNDLNGKTMRVLPKDEAFEIKKQIQLGHSFYWKNGKFYISYGMLVPKNEGVYLVHGGFDSIEEYQEMTKDGLGIGGKGGYQMTKEDIDENETYFYISGADARKALGK